MNIATFLKIHPLDNDKPVREVKLHPKVKANSQLASFLSQAAKNSFSNGFFRTIDCDALNDIRSIWKWYNDDVIIFLRTAFGGLFYQRKADFFFYDPLYGDRVNLANDLEFILNVFLCDERSLSSTFLFPLYNAAINHTGVPAEDECLGFFPALKLGGEKKIENLNIVKLEEHLYFLSQL